MKYRLKIFEDKDGTTWYITQAKKKWYTRWYDACFRPFTSEQAALNHITWLKSTFFKEKYRYRIIY